jgi:hypothetical protein
MTEAAYRNAVAEAMAPSKSLARRRFRLIQAEKRSTTHRRGNTTLFGQLAHDLDDDARGIGYAFGSVSGEGEDALDEGKQAARGLKQRPGAVAVLNRGRMHSQNKRPAICIDQGMAFAACHLLAGVALRVQFVGQRRGVWA